MIEFLLANPWVILMWFLIISGLPYLWRANNECYWPTHNMPRQ
jgi:hypothetical protein